MTLCKVIYSDLDCICCQVIKFNFIKHYPPDVVVSQMILTELN